MSERIKITLSDVNAHFVKNHPSFAEMSVSEAVTFCINQVRLSLINRQLAATSESNPVLKNLYNLFIILDHAERMAIAQHTSLTDLDRFHATFGFRFEEKTDYD